MLYKEMLEVPLCCEESINKNVWKNKVILLIYVTIYLVAITLQAKPVFVTA